jgi:hypothetical protein
MAGQAYRAAGSGEQRNPHPSLQACDGPGERGLGNAQYLRRASEMLLTRDDDELPQPGNERIKSLIHAGIGGCVRPVIHM